MVGGLGLDAKGTRSAIADLPGPVTLGFAPYGPAIGERAAQAREAGHETVLQAPMEDFFDSADDPGPHMLKMSASDADNVNSLRWLMSRFTGYVAVVNHLGGKFTADREEITSVMREIAARGLGYLDDGVSPRSLAQEVAATLAMPSARADVRSTPIPRPRPSMRRWRASSISRVSMGARSASPPLRLAASSDWPHGPRRWSRRASPWSRSPR